METQKTEFWNSERLGRFTASEIWKLLGEPKSKADKDAGNLSQTALTYILDKIGEKKAGYSPEFDSFATAYGNEQEPIAREKYENANGVSVTEKGFVVHPDFAWLGGSPDGVVENEIKGIIEIKCPFVFHNHYEHCMIDSVEYFKANFKEYYFQCQLNMILNDASYCDFISYDGRLSSMFIFRLPKVDEDCKMIISKSIQARKKMEELARKFNVEL